MAAIAVHQMPYRAGDIAIDQDFERLEERYLQVEKRYSTPQRNALGKMLGITVLAHQTDFRDFLGSIASEQELLNQDAGQFFTPYDVCRMMAQMTLGDARSIVEENGLITVLEPAAGGGAMVIACAEDLHRQQIDPRSCAQFDCIDVSRDAFNMCYIQTSLYELQAVVRHGNTLSNEMWESRPTPQMRYFDQWLQERRQMARLEAMRDLIVNPAKFFSDAEVALESANDDVESVPDSPAPEAIASEPVQMSLLEMDTKDAGPSGQRRPTRRADVQLPADRQIGLFDIQNEGS